MVKTVKRKRKGGASLASLTSATQENVNILLSHASKKEILEMLEAINTRMEVIKYEAAKEEINKYTMIEKVEGLKNAVDCLNKRLINPPQKCDYPNTFSTGGKRRKSRRKRKRRRSKRR